MPRSVFRYTTEHQNEFNGKSRANKANRFSRFFGTSGPSQYIRIQICARLDRKLFDASQGSKCLLYLFFFESNSIAYSNPIESWWSQISYRRCMEDYGLKWIGIMCRTIISSIAISLEKISLRYLCFVKYSSSNRVAEWANARTSRYRLILNR